MKDQDVNQRIEEFELLIDLTLFCIGKFQKCFHLIQNYENVIVCLNFVSHINHPFS